MEKEIKAVHGRYLGVDYGDARTGLAVSDASGLLAGALGYIKAGGMRGMAQAVAEAAQKENVVRIVIGLPRNMDGSEGFRAEAVRRFCELLAEETDIPLDLMDERLSTCEAHRYLSATGKNGRKRKDVVDSLSAQIILQDYLDRERSAFSANSAKN